MSRLLSALALVVACSTVAFAESAKPSFGTWGVDLSAMDRSIKPADDFFLYSNGCYPAAGASNPHSPAPFRVIGATRNLDDWYNAFAAGSARETLVKPA